MKTYISLFSSAGVGCYGFRDHFQCIATNELIKERLDVQRANAKCRYESGYICGDITSPEIQNEIYRQIDFWREHERLGQVDVIFATPPCQGMSTANYKKSETEQVRNSLVVEAIKIIKNVQPKIFIFENVRAFMKTVCTDVSGIDMPIKDSIFNNLSDNYHISWKVINFKDYGVPSSRPRTIVIGTQKSLKNISPLNLFPTRRPEITMRDAIGHLHPLDFGARDTVDPFHFARIFPAYQLPWIANLQEGKSAFTNPFETRPHKLNQQGERVELKGAYMGNKYRRLVWDKPCSCIATRNDQLASQDTIHPVDNRVLSIRELMILMSIPDTFRWTSHDHELTPETSETYLKENELNIRRCIGEAVPTRIIADIAKKASDMLDFEKFVNEHDESRLNAYLRNRRLTSNFYIYTYIKEQLIEDAKHSGSFYTPQCVVYDALKDVDNNKDIVHILEPAVGLGAFLPQLSALFSESTEIHIDAVEIDPATIKVLKRALKKIDLGSNVHIRFICGDFLKWKRKRHYDLVAVNPPYGTAGSEYRNSLDHPYKFKNLFAMFMLKLYGCADEIACVIPKNFILADEFAPLRTLYENYGIVSICDFGVKFFKKVFVEIISIHFSQKYNSDVMVKDLVNNRQYIHEQGYIFHDRIWLIYRDTFFDNFIENLRLDIFDSFRDRQITNKKLSNSGRIWVLRSKNILEDGNVIHKSGYDRYVDSADEFAVGQYIDSKCIIMPNFTYNTRATILPDNTIPNGSIAILIPKEGETVTDLSFYASEEFRRYYAIVKSYSRFTLNIDKCSLYYIGKPI